MKDYPHFDAFIFGIVMNKKILKYLGDMPQFKFLSRIEQTTLKEIFKHVEKFQGKMRFDFIGA